MDSKQKSNPHTELICHLCPFYCKGNISWRERLLTKEDEQRKYAPTGVGSTSANCVHRQIIPQVLTTRIEYKTQPCACTSACVSLRMYIGLPAALRYQFESRSIKINLIQKISILCNAMSSNIYRRFRETRYIQRQNRIDA